MDLVEVTSSNFGDPGFVVTAFDKVDFGERYGCSPLLLGYLHLVHSPRGARPLGAALATAVRQRAGRRSFQIADRARRGAR